MRITSVSSLQDAAVAGALVREYFLSWGIDDVDDPELLEELAGLRALYGPPEGCILLAWMDEEPAGVVCLRRQAEGTCVMKRMFVRPPFRRHGVARCLALELLFWAERLGYTRMVLDTPQENTPALVLYRSIGFTETGPYEAHEHHGHSHEHPNWAFLALDLPQPDEVWFDRIRTLLETAYLSTENVYRQSGHLGDAARWALTRGIVADCIDRDGTYLDVGCANGLLMESVARWCADKGLKMEPYGVDISSGLAELARKRLPQWADRIFVGNAFSWEPPMQFDFVSTRIEYVPERHYPAYLQGLLDRAVAPGGRLIVLAGGLRQPDYVPGPERLRAWGFDVGGELERRDASGEPVSRAAWIAR